MNGFAVLFGLILLLFIAIGIPVAISRWVFRVNVQVALLEKISKNIETLVTIEKMRKP